MSILITGAAGFIGSNFIYNWLKKNKEKVIALDKLTYAGNLDNFKNIEDSSFFCFLHGDIGDRDFIRYNLKKYQPRSIINFAAESHVDRSIHGPDDFIQTNIIGTYNLLEEVLYYFEGLSNLNKSNFRFLHISTDEVYGSLDSSDLSFTEETPYRPNSPYSASKASSDHLVRAWFHTYNLPVLTSNCSNNYGPYQFPEKLIPLVISKAINLEEIPIYGDGKQIRDWLYVDDHCDALNLILKRGRLGQTYNIGGMNEKTNLDVVSTICDKLDIIYPNKKIKSYRNLITFINDRPGHDRRYSINPKKISNELNWIPKETFDSGIDKTLDWYLLNQNWVNNIISGEYVNWLKKNYK